MLATISLLTACGEGFKANHSNNAAGTESGGDLGGLTGSLPGGEEAEVVSETPVSIDQQILNDYVANFGAMTSNEAIAMHNGIRALQLFVTRTTNSNMVNLSVRMRTSCDAGLTFSRNNVDVSQLRSGQMIQLSVAGNYSVRVHCTTDNCQEAILGVSRAVSQDRDTFILFAQRQQAQPAEQIGSTIRIFEYVSRFVMNPPYFRSSMTLDHHAAFCANQSATNTGSGTGTGTGSVTVVNPTGGVAPTSGSTGGLPFFDYDGSGPF